jgi:2-haloacid dehalogenase
MPPKTVLAFDLYGTLLNTGSIASTLAQILSDEDMAQTVATHARRLQLEYSWRVNCMGLYKGFDELTRASFRQAAREQAGHKLTALDEARLMQAYNGLDTFKDVDEAMKILSDAKQKGNNNVEAFIFSNGTPSMLSESLTTSPALSSASTVLPDTKLISVEGAGCYKPDPRAYKHLVEVSGAAAAEDVWLVSSNPFDAMGAVAAGLKSAWVDRDGQGWRDGLGAALEMRPTVTARGVDGAVRDIVAMSQ